MAEVPVLETGFLVSETNVLATWTTLLFKNLKYIREVRVNNSYIKTNTIYPKIRQ